MSKTGNVMIPEDLLVEICMYLLDDDPDPASRWALLDRLSKKIDAICRRRDYGAAIGAKIRARDARVQDVADKESPEDDVNVN